MHPWSWGELCGPGGPGEKLEWNGLSGKAGLGEQLESEERLFGMDVKVAGLGRAIVTARRAPPKARSLAGQR